MSRTLRAVGYAWTAAEIAEQWATQAGLAVGASLARPSARITGIDIDAEPARVRADLVRYAEEAARLLGVPFDVRRIEVVAGMAGPAYGVPHDAAPDALSLMARLEALVLDPVYSAKGLAGLIEFVRRGTWRRDEHVVFIHTGGSPTVFAYADAVRPTR